MKTVGSILFFLISVSAFAQQTAFLDVPKHGDDFKVPVFGSGLSDLFADPAGQEKVTIFAEDLDSASYYDFSKLVNLEVVHIQFSFSPDSSDEAKKRFQEQTKKHLMNLSYFSKCPKLRVIIFAVGEQIYVEHKNCLPLTNVEKVNYNKQYDRMSKENLENAWIDFGKELNVLLPNVKLYAYTWNW